MRKVYWDEITQLAKLAKGKIHKLYLHWTAGHYDDKHYAYHFNITGNGDVYVSTDDFTKVLSHTWQRNTASVGIALCCCSDAVVYGDRTFTYGKEPPTREQIEAMSMLVALLTEIWNIPLDEQHVMTHAEAADLDGYGPQMMGTLQFEKWDLWRLPDYDGGWRSGGVVLRGKAIYYRLRG